MTTSITTRAGKGSALTHNEVDANFTNLKATADAAAVLGANAFSAGQSMPSVTLGTISSVTGQLKLANAGSVHLTTIQAGVAAAARTYTLPTNLGSAGAVLTDSGGDGTLSWIVPSGNGDMLLASVQTVTGAKQFGTVGGAVGKLILAGSTSGTSILNAAAAAGNGTITLPPGTDTLAGLGTAQTWTAIQTHTAAVRLGSALGSTGALQLAHASSGYLTTIQAGNAAAARTYTWPTNFGAANSVLTDAAGNGTLSWSTIAGASLPTGTGFYHLTSGVMDVAAASVDLSTDVVGTLPAVVNAQTGTSYTIQNTDQGSIVTLSNASPIAVTLPNATGDFAAGYSVTVENIGAGLVTISPQTALIDGGSSLILARNQGVFIVSYGGNYYTFRGMGGGIAQITMTLDGGGSAIDDGAVSICVPCTFAGTIVAWTITVDTGTCTLKTWKKATGSAIPTGTDSINTSGVAIASGTVIRSTTLSDFTTLAVAANDLFIAYVEAISNATKISFTLEILKT